MSIHKNVDRGLPVIGVAPEGLGSVDLTKGQLGLFNVSKGAAKGPRGSKALHSLAGLNKKQTLLEFKVGSGSKVYGAGRTDKPFSTFPFRVDDVENVSVTTPKTFKNTLDEVLVGYDGYNDDTAITFKPGDNFKVNIKLSGAVLGFHGYENECENFQFYLPAEACNNLGGCSECDDCAEADCRPIIEAALEWVRTLKLRNQVPVTDLLEIYPTTRCMTPGTAPVETDALFYCISLCDTGDDFALNAVAIQYPGLTVVRTERVGATSTYQVLKIDGGAAPADYEQTLPSVMPGCEGCPAGYTEVEGGLIYAVTLEDDGADLASAVEALANAEAGTAIKSSEQNNGVGYYTVLLTQTLSDTDLATFVAANPTATVTYVGEVSSICENGTVTTTAWVACGGCKVSTKDFEIVLPDGECGTSRLDELQRFYPHLVITEAESSAKACQRKYATTVPTNIVCDECDPVFKDTYRAEAPGTFDFTSWSPVAVATDGVDCLCGFRLKGKALSIFTDECYRDEITPIDSSVRIEVSAGYTHDLTVQDLGPTGGDLIAVKYVSRAGERTGMGYQLRGREDEGFAFFSGQPRSATKIGRALLGDTSLLQDDVQYLDYAVSINADEYAQSFSQKGYNAMTIHFWVPVGQHQGVEELVNMVAAAAGLPTVQATAI